MRAITAALRASLGHPDPFTLRFVEIGNEVGNHSTLFYHRRSFARLDKARLMLISTTGLHWLCSVDVSASDARIRRLRVKIEPCNSYPYRWRDFFGNLSAEFPQIRAFPLLAYSVHPWGLTMRIGKTCRVPRDF